MPLSDDDQTVKPYVELFAQKGAIPGTHAGDDYHHEEVTNLLLIAVIATIVIAICISIVMKWQERKAEKRMLEAQR
jgi:hypothetical protein